MSSQLDAQVGSDTKANPYLVCFCDECDECTCCKNDDYHTTAAGVAGAMRKAGQVIVGSKNHKNADLHHEKNQDDLNKTDHRLWFSITDKKSNVGPGKFFGSLAAFRNFEADFSMDQREIQKHKFEWFQQKSKCIGPLADRLIKKKDYELAMKELAEILKKIKLY